MKADSNHTASGSSTGTKITTKKTLLSPAAMSRELRFAGTYRVSAWATDALCWATENGIINGKGSGILDPGGWATRAEAAQMLKNFIEYLVK